MKTMKHNQAGLLRRWLCYTPSQRIASINYRSAFHKMSFVRQLSSKLPSSFDHKVPNRKYLDIEGIDAAKFLQGLVTNDMKLLDSPHGAGSMQALFLNRQGRIISDAIIYEIKLSDSGKQQQASEPQQHASDNTITKTSTDMLSHSRRFVVEFHKDLMNELANHLLQHRLRLKTTIKEISLSTFVQATTSAAESDRGSNDATTADIVAVVPDPRSADWGFRIVRKG